MLKPEPRTRQTHEYGGWNGTPQQLVDVATALRGLLPAGDFRVTITRDKDRPELTATEPEALAEVPVNEPPPKVRCEVEEYRIRKNDHVAGDRYVVVLTLSDYMNRVECDSPTEMESRVFLETMKDALRPGIPWHVTLKHRQAGTC